MLRRWCNSPGTPNLGFTFVEVLVAIVFIGIVVPITVQAIITANRAGLVAERKRVATRLAEAKLAELVLTDGWRYGEVEGDFGEDFPDYTWTIAESAWDEDAMIQLTLTVSYVAQGRAYQVSQSTLVPESEETGSEDATMVQ